MARSGQDDPIAERDEPNPGSRGPSQRGSVRLLTFDLDNTLWPVWEVIERAEVVLRTCLMDRYPDHRAGFSTESLRESRAELLREHPTYAADLTRLRRDSIQRHLEALGLSPSEAVLGAKIGFEAFYEARNDVRLFSGVRETLEALSQRFVLGALTNGNANVYKIGLGDYFEFQYSAEGVGKRKPDPEMFRCGLRHASVVPDQVVHIGDHPVEDVRAALDLGMGAVWANPMGTAWPDDQEPPEHSFSSFDELLVLASRWE